MNIFAEIRTSVIETLDAMVADGHLPSGLSWGNVAAEPPRDAAHGDMATNSAMVLTKEAGETALARIVSDYIAGMTGRFALQCHERFVGGVDASAMRSVPVG